MIHGDTIVAISTPPGRGAIGVVRMSGPESLAVAGSLFRPKSRPLGAVRSPYLGKVVDPETGQAIDNAILIYFQAPKSYTGEDVIEISCHGSPVVLGSVLKLAAALGARLAEPGEFTMRAFFSRRMDLAQAQAVRDVIDAQTEYQARVAARQLGGLVSRRLKPFKDGLIEIVVHLESSIEFVEEDILPETRNALLQKLGGIIDSLNEMRGGFSFGKYVREGFELAIVGRPNVGKSSVFNRLIGSERAIVTALAGTTRDALYESISVRGVPVRLIDTAGMRETQDVVETIGIQRSEAAVAEAAVSLVVLDRSERLTADDFRLLEKVPKQRRIILLNKADLPAKLEEDLLREKNEDSVIPVSALTAAGFEKLTEAIFEKLSGKAVHDREDILVTDARQEAALGRAVALLSEARALMVMKEHEEILLLKLRAALDALGEITGETLTEEILSQIFSTFCVGK